MASPAGDINEGMTLRDWFAGQALGSLAVAEVQRAISARHFLGKNEPVEIDSVARLAYWMADQMLAERAK